MTKHKDQIKKQAEEFLWANGGMSAGGYGGGRRALKKMPWFKMMQGK